MDKRFVILLTVFFFVFIFFIFMVVIKIIPINANSNLKPSGQNSLILGWPLTIPADGVTRATITAFVRSDDTNSIPNEVVTLNTSMGTLDQSVITSDANGKVETSFTCTTTGTAHINGIIQGNIPITQQISIKCE